MRRPAVFIALALLLSSSLFLVADEDEKPAVTITSPDTATTFVIGSIKSHSLIWNKQRKELIAEVTFTDAEVNFGQPNDDTHEFRLPGVTFDEAKGIFYALSDKGESIPVARFKKVLFIKTIETTSNAVVRVLYPKGNVQVILEAISPNDPAMHAPSSTDPDGSHKVDLNQIAQ
jgi:hypothetical protein